MPKFDFNVKLHNYRPHDDIKRGQLEILCEGEDCNEQFINAIGRIATVRLPMYAFAHELIKIERINPETGYRDSIPFNHDYMRMRLANIPVMNIDPGFAVLHERFWKNVDYRNPDREIHEKEKRVEAYIDAKNTAAAEDTESILHVTTNDMKIYVDDELVTPYSKEYPLLIISLKSKEAFKCTLKAVLGVGVNNTCWDACSNYCYDQETYPNKILAKFQSASQFDEYTLIMRSIEYFRHRTLMLKDEIKRMYLMEKNHSDRFQIEILDEDHTMGEPINYELQSHPNILKSAVSKPNHLVRRVVIDVLADEPDKLLDSVMESFDNLVAKIDHFEKEFIKIAPSVSVSQSQSQSQSKSKSKSDLPKSNEKDNTKVTTKSNSKSNATSNVTKKKKTKK